jgi:hypothetical protein
MYADTHIPNVWLVPHTYEMTNPIPTRFPARSIINDVMVIKETKTSTTLPYRTAQTSSSVKILVMLLIFLAKMMPFRVQDEG